MTGTAGVPDRAPRPAPRSFAPPNLVGPGDPGYDRACGSFNVAGVPAPAEALVATTVAEVSAAVRYAVAAERPVRVLATGHNPLSRPPMDGALLIRTELGEAVRADPRARTAWVAAGTRWEPVVRAAAAHGLTALHGSSPTIGVVGYLLHGGLSFYGRRHGVAANHVRALELVTASGDLVRVDAEHDPELFWALRGGGGGFGIVTAVEIELIPVAAAVSGAIFWPAEVAGSLLPAWRDWAADAPREITTSLRLLNLPPLPGVPEALTGRQVLCLDGTAHADTPEGTGRCARIVADMLAPLRAIAEPIMDTWGRVGPVDVLRTHMDPDEPLPYFSDHHLLAELPDTLIAGFLAAAGPASGSPLLLAELRQLGGTFADPATPSGGVFDRVAAPWLYFAVGVPMGPATPAAIAAQHARTRAVLAPAITPFTAPSFIESTQQRQRTFDTDTARSVAAIRDRVDPDGIFRGDVSRGALPTPESTA
ncbi:MAG: FAD-binding oxidoreductase [Pseudonocardiaceae bacterium]